ncbi:MAG: hypothetical protein KKB31_04820 [Nanoarchaeota archaeon]|nr:hypothetical protein [Nanoarchaeota archaeon]
MGEFSIKEILLSEMAFAPPYSLGGGIRECSTIPCNYSGGSGRRRTEECTTVSGQYALRSLDGIDCVTQN